MPRRYSRHSRIVSQTGLVESEWRTHFWQPITAVCAGGVDIVCAGSFVVVGEFVEVNDRVEVVVERGCEDTVVEGVDADWELDVGSRFLQVGALTASGR